MFGKPGVFGIGFTNGLVGELGRSPGRGGELGDSNGRKGTRYSHGKWVGVGAGAGSGTEAGRPLNKTSG